jgi:hypothetical protein
MHSPIRFLALVMLALLATSAVAWKPINKNDAGMCADKSQDAAQAIVAFCQRFPMVSLLLRKGCAQDEEEKCSQAEQPGDEEEARSKSHPN